MGQLLSELTLETFHDSLDRVFRNHAFFDRFYDRFIASSPEIAGKFAGIDLGRVKRMVRDSFYLKMMVSDGNLRAFERLESLAELHAHLDIPKSMHAAWLDALLATVDEFDPSYDATIEQSWRDVVGIGLSIIMAKAPDG